MGVKPFIPPSQCARTILGVGKPEKTYRTFELEEWKEAVQQESAKSGLPSALRQLTCELVEQKKQKILLSEAKSLHSRILKINIGQQ
jgi:hypothetical protein